MVQVRPQPPNQVPATQINWSWPILVSAPLTHDTLQMLPWALEPVQSALMRDDSPGMVVGHGGVGVGEGVGEPVGAAVVGRCVG